jgi:flavodoxin
MKSPSQKMLVVYYSWSGNTRSVALTIQSLTGADVFEIKPVKPYPKSYNECTTYAKKEIEKGYKPELTDTMKHLEQYDVIFVGSPNWWYTIAPPMATFLSGYDFSGKIIAPFCTHGGGGQANLFSDIAKLCPNADVKKGLVVHGHSAKTAKNHVSDWLKELGMKSN